MHRSIRSACLPTALRYLPGTLSLLAALCLTFVPVGVSARDAEPRPATTESAAAESATAESATARSILEKLPRGGLFVFPVGRCPEGEPIDSLVQAEDLEYGGEKFRILLVGENGAAASRIGGALHWFHDQESERASAARASFLISAIPDFTAGQGGAGRLAFPPSGTAYIEPDGGAGHSIWRWIGMHAPDLVVVVRAVDRDGGWFVPKAEFSRWKALRQALGTPTTGRRDELAAALVAEPACGTGRIPALRLDLASEARDSFLPALLRALRAVDFQRPSPARRSLRARAERTPREVAEQLGRHYGHELGSVVYIPAVALIGRLRLGELNRDSTPLGDVRRIVAPYYDGQKDSAPRSGSGLSGHLIFTQLAERTQGAERERFIALARHAADQAFDAQGRLRPSMPYHSEMSDALFMGGPVLSDVGHLTGDPRYFDACLRHLRFMRGLVLRDDGLYRHSPLDPAAWGRGNGFPALGLALCLTHWPRDREDYAELLAMFRAHLTALIAHQDASGCWHQVIDRPDSYRELSATSMITFAMARGLREGWLPEDRFRPVVERGWRAIGARVAADGGLVDVCTGTGKQKSLEAYYDRPAILGRDPRGGAMALLAATEIAALRDSDRASGKTSPPDRPDSPGDRPGSK